MPYIDQNKTSMLIFEQAVQIDEETGDYKSYWPDFWPLDRLARRLGTGKRAGGNLFFAASYQNDPAAMEGNILKTSWLHYYTADDLERALAGAKGVVRYAGIDLGEGGDIQQQSDFSSIVVGDRIGNKLFLVAYYYRKLSIEDQAQKIEEFLDIYNPHFTVIEDTALKGYVWKDFMTQINDGSGTKHAITIETPQSRASMAKLANKATRFLAMAPRFQNGQILVPGEFDKTIEAHLPIREWMPWFDQWANFPAGHDDILDATEILARKAFEVAPGFAVSTVPGADDPTLPQNIDITKVCARPAHVAYGKTINNCERCLLEAIQAEVNAANDRAIRGEVRERSIGEGYGRQRRFRMLR